MFKCNADEWKSFDIGSLTGDSFKNYPIYNLGQMIQESSHGSLNWITAADSAITYYVDEFRVSWKACLCSAVLMDT